MAKEKKVDLRQEAETKMETLVEQHNTLVQEIQEANGRLGEVKQMIVEHLLKSNEIEIPTPSLFFLCLRQVDTL